MMTKRNAPFLLVLCALAGLISVGCTQPQTEDETPAETSTQLTSTSATGGCECCSEQKQETQVCAKCGQEKPVGANAEGCSDCPIGQCAQSGSETGTGKQTGCCGKCAQEQTVSAAATPSCKNCQQCADGDSKDCKCESEPVSSDADAEGTQSDPKN